jgi:hypothetical protein
LGYLDAKQLTPSIHIRREVLADGVKLTRRQVIDCREIESATFLR